MRHLFPRLNAAILVGTVFFLLAICLAHPGGADTTKASAPESASSTPKRVLILNSYHSGMPFSDEEVRGIHETLPPDTEIFIEYMDAKRRHDASYMALLARIYELKYVGKQFDAIQSLDDDALNFLLDNADRIFPGIPIVFCGVNNYRPDRLVGRTTLTGVVETMDIEPTLAMAVKLYPQAKQVLVITDRSSTGTSNRSILEAVAASGRLGIPMRFLDDGSGLDLPEIIDKLKSEQTPSIVYYSDFFLDKNGHTVNIETVMPQVTGVAPGPVMVHSGMYLGHGALGGKINSGYYQGSKAAELVMRIWAGETPASIPVVHEEINRFTLDYRVLERWGIDVSRVSFPEQAVIVNQPEDIFQGYGRYLVAAAAFIILEALLILLLLKLLREQRHLREEARRSEALLRGLLEQAPVPLGYATDDGKMLAVNSALTKVLGYTLEDVPSLADWWEKAYPDPDYRREVQKRWEGMMRSPSRVASEFRLTARDGSVRDMLIGVTIQGRFIVASFFDITERKQQEEQLRQSEEKFSRIFQMAPEGIAFMRLADSVIIDANAAFESITGVPPAELIGRPAGNLHAWTSGHDEAEYMRLLMQEGLVQNFEYTFRHRDGSLHRALLSARKVSMSGGECAVSITHDITETKKMQEMMIQTEKMLSVGGIAAGIAHEINNPLGIILQNAQTLAQRMDSAFPKNVQAAQEVGLDLESFDAYSRVRKLGMFVADIQSAAVRAAGIIRHMLDFSRRSESRRTFCEIGTIIDHAVSLASNDFDLKKNFDFKRIRVTRDVAPDIPSITCTETEIEQVFLNLLRNSAQAMAGLRDRNPAIDIRVWRDENMVYVVVSDNGPGISKDIQRRIFEPFFTTKGPGVGTGLGLSVSYFIVTKGHGGTMTVESSPGEGCSFTVALPLQESTTTGENDETSTQSDAR